MAKSRIELLLEDIAKKHNKPYYVVWEVYMSQFKKVREEMSSLRFETIKLPSWGKYIPSEERVIKYRENHNINNDAGGEAKNTEDNSI